MADTPQSSSTSGAATPTEPPQPASFLSYPVSRVASSLYRRLTEPSPFHPAPAQNKSQTSWQSTPTASTHSGVYTPPHRSASPFQPPPLTPLTLKGASESPILNKAVAEEVRLLVPPRLQLADTWTLAYSLENDGVALTTLFQKCAAPKIPRESSFVLVVQDGTGGIFGAYLTDPPAPAASFYGTGECFLWRASTLPTASLLSNLPPPPSAPDTDLENAGRSTTIAVNPTSPSQPHHTNSAFSPSSSSQQNLSPSLEPPSPNPAFKNDPSGGTATPDSVRFKAFPYSGVNDYLIFCEHEFLSVGGGDGKYGLWLDGVLERGISSHCMTFGNEPLSEEGEKFEIVGVEVWWVGS